MENDRGWNPKSNSIVSMNGSATPAPIGSSSIGYQLLKKHGWQEGTGLGVLQQGRLDPVEAYLKTNKRGLGADKTERKSSIANDTQISSNDKTYKEAIIKKKLICKRLKKMEEEEKRAHERQFEREFFMLFWPDNV